MWMLSAVATMLCICGGPLMVLAPLLCLCSASCWFCRSCWDVVADDDDLGYDTPTSAQGGDGSVRIGGSTRSGDDVEVGKIVRIMSDVSEKEDTVAAERPSTRPPRSSSETNSPSGTMVRTRSAIVLRLPPMMVWRSDSGTVTEDDERSCAWISLGCAVFASVVISAAGVLLVMLTGVDVNVFNGKGA